MPQCHDHGVAKRNRLQIGAFLMLIRVRRKRGRGGPFVGAVKKRDCGVPDRCAGAYRLSRLCRQAPAAAMVRALRAVVWPEALSGADAWHHAMTSVYAAQALQASHPFQRYARRGCAGDLPQWVAYMPLEKFCRCCTHQIELRRAARLAFTDAQRRPHGQSAQRRSPAAGRLPSNYRDIHQHAALLLKQPHMRC